VDSILNLQGTREFVRDREKYYNNRVVVAFSKMRGQTMVDTNLKVGVKMATMAKFLNLTNKIFNLRENVKSKTIL